MVLIGFRWTRRCFRSLRLPMFCLFLLVDAEVICDWPSFEHSDPMMSSGHRCSLEDPSVSKEDRTQIACKSVLV